MNQAALAQCADVLGVVDLQAHRLGGGCIADVFELRAGERPCAVAKCGETSVLHEEANGLNAIEATRTVRVPEVFAVLDDGILLLEHLANARQANFEQFGAGLAALHDHEVGDRYGFRENNHLGPTLQVNDESSDWCDFTRTRRLEPLRNAVCERGLLTGNDAQEVNCAIDRVDVVLDKHPRPALLHGDLWSGNALPLASGEVALIDPAVSIGDRFCDIAMMQLFGGFPRDTFDAYATASESWPSEQCLALYRLYHMLNHLLLFGTGYRDGVLREARCASS
jgi:protein-ribulosamine 3-kinase